MPEAGCWQAKAWLLAGESARRKRLPHQDWPNPLTGQSVQQGRPQKTMACPTFYFTFITNRV
ncbi:hypothetical protein SBA4_2050007 [Candidatus Sulfopaludibacter sp. SbA4]|nr:hypothetical protein SBA4_2050007 [Candidatus Sulfopaludibacter sp. SbA4]